MLLKRSGWWLLCRLRQLQRLMRVWLLIPLRMCVSDSWFLRCRQCVVDLVIGRTRNLRLSIRVKTESYYFSYFNIWFILFFIILIFECHVFRESGMSPGKLRCCRNGVHGILNPQESNPQPVLTRVCAESPRLRLIITIYFEKSAFYFY